MFAHTFKLRRFTFIFALFITALVLVNEGYGQRNRTFIPRKTTPQGTDLILTPTEPTTATPDANPAADLDQCLNGPSSTPSGCASAGAWSNGNANENNSHWAENQFIAYRTKLSNLTAGSTYTLVIGYDILTSGKRSIDYLGSYNATETTADPCAGVTHCGSFTPTTFSVPTDNVTVTNNTNPNTNSPITQILGQFTLWGGSFSSVTYNTYGGGNERQITVVFTASASQALLAWGGHIAWQGDWGAGNSASGINGSPYHMRIISLNGQGGNQDRSLKATAVIPSGAIIIQKQVQNLNGSQTSTVPFSFTASSSFTPLSFTLTDNNPSGPVSKQSDAITQFGPSFAVTVTETSANSNGYTLSDITCTENVNPNSTTNVSGGSATIIVDFNEIVTCTFTNSQLTPSAGPSEVTGRVVDVYGRPIVGAQLALFGASGNYVKYAYTNTFGYYRFADVPTGEFYILTVSDKTHMFINNSVSFSLEQSLSGINFRSYN
jgi:hypothetical protein